MGPALENGSKRKHVPKHKTWLNTEDRHQDRKLLVCVQNKMERELLGGGGTRGRYHLADWALNRYQEKMLHTGIKGPSAGGIQAISVLHSLATHI